jgi:stress response protein YsnF
MTRNGKIARLPRPLRDGLNQRLARNEDGATLLDWLNAAPDVKDLLARDFAGEPISQQNLHEWRQGGFVEWQSRQDLFAEAAELTDANGEWDALAANDFTERLAAVLVVRYANALAGWNGGDDEAFRLKLRDLRRFNQDLAVLRRYNQSAARLKMEQKTFYQEEKQPAEATASTRKQSAAGARADDERLAQRRREAAATQTSACATSEASTTSASSAVAAPTCVADRTTANQGVACVAAGVRDTGSPALNEDQTRSCAPAVRQMVPAPEFSPVPDRISAECDAGKNMALDAATLAAGLIRTNLLVEFANSLSNSLRLIKEKSVHAHDLKDRRAVQSAYAGSVATVNRLGKEAGWLRAELPGFAGVDRVYTAVEILQREYLRIKSNLFQRCTATIAVGIPQLRDAACELRENLQRKAATTTSLAA